MKARLITQMWTIWGPKWDFFRFRRVLPALFPVHRRPSGLSLGGQELIRHYGNGFCDADRVIPKVNITPFQDPRPGSGSDLPQAYREYFSLRSLWTAAKNGDKIPLKGGATDE